MPFGKKFRGEATFRRKKLSRRRSAFRIKSFHDAIFFFRRGKIATAFSFKTFKIRKGRRDRSERRAFCQGILSKKRETRFHKELSKKFSKGEIFSTKGNFYLFSKRKVVKKREKPARAEFTTKKSMLSRRKGREREPRHSRYRIRSNTFDKHKIQELSQKIQVVGSRLRQGGDAERSRDLLGGIPRGKERSP